MQTQSDERDIITKLFHDAFVRVCQLAIADCGMSVVDLTLHLSIELNPGTPQILGTVVAEKVRPLSAKYSGEAGRSDALNKSFSADNNNVDSDTSEKEPIACDSFDSLVHGNSVETSGLEVESSPQTCTEESAFKAAEDTPLTTCDLTINSINNLILSDNGHETVPLEELLSDVVESNECSNSACIATDSALSDSRCTDIETGRLAERYHLLYGKMADRPAAEGDISYGEELIVDESYSSSNTSANHVESLQPELCSSLNSQPVSSEAATCVNDISFLKLHPANCLLPKCCPDVSNPTYTQQPKIPTISPSSCRLVRANSTDTAIVPWETEFQKILSTMSTNVTNTTDACQDNLHKYVTAEQFADDQMKRYPCTQCDCSFSMWTNLRRHIKKSHCQPLWRPIAPTAGMARKQSKMAAASTPLKVARISAKGSSRYRHKCTICKAVFTLRTNLTRHVRRIHGSTNNT